MVNLEKSILQSGPARKLVNTSKRLVLPGFEGIVLYDVVTFFRREMKNISLAERAAAISFNFLLAIPPFFIFLFTLVPFIPMKNIEPALYELAESITPNYNTYIIVRDMIHDFLYTHRNGLLSIAFLTGYFYSSNAVMGIMRSFNKVQRGFRQRKWWQRRLLALQLTALLSFLLIIAVVLIIVQGKILGTIFDALHIQNAFIRSSIDAVRWALIVLLFFSIIAVIYRFAPATPKRWKFITPGSTLATVLMILATLGFSFFVNNFGNYNKIYGSVGTILILMLWVFFNSFILLVGFELNVGIQTLKARSKAREVASGLPAASNA